MFDVAPIFSHKKVIYYFIFLLFQKRIITKEKISCSDCTAMQLKNHKS